MIERAVGEGKILLVGEAPSRSDFLANKPFVGMTGKELDKMLHEAGIMRTDCHITYVCQKPMPKKRGEKAEKRFFLKHTKKYQVPKPEVVIGKALLHTLIVELKPTLIITLGELALWAVTGEIGITKWRGSILEVELDSEDGTGSDYFKVVPTYAPDVVCRKWDWRFIAVQDLRRAEKESHFPEVNVPDYNFIIRPSFGKTMDILNKLCNLADAQRDTTTNGKKSHDCITDKNAPHMDATGVRIKDGKLILGGDIETRRGHISCFGIAWSKLDAICIPFMCVENNEGYWSYEEERAILWKLHELFTHPNVGWIFQNGIYDLQYFAVRWGFIPKMWMDTMLAHHTCFAGLPKGLDFQSSIYCAYHRYWKDEGKEFHESVKSPSDEDQYWVYNCKDCVTEFENAEVLSPMIERMGQTGPYEFQMAQFMPVLRMMLRGVNVNVVRKEELTIELMDAIAERQAWLEEVVGHPLNPKSPKQMQEFFYDEVGLPTQKVRKTGKPTTNHEALETLAKKEPLIKPITDCISDLRSLGVFLSTFIKAPLGEDGRLRSSYNIAGTETFRWSSSKDAFGTGLNLQNIPKGDE